MRSILVPVDGSALSEAALPVALAIARQHRGAHVEAVCVLVPPPHPLRVSGAPVRDTRLEHDFRIETEAYVEHVGRRLAAEAPDVPTSAKLLVGVPVDQLVVHAAAHDLIVMTTHGRSGASRLWLGSVADRLVRQSPVPVLLLRDPTAAVTVDLAAMFERVVVPLDGADTSEEILTDAIALAGRRATYHLVSVVVPLRWMPPPSSMDVLAGGVYSAVAPPDLIGPLRDAALTHTGSVAARLHGEGFQVRTHVAIHGNPAEAILAYADECGARLIAMTSHGRGALGRMLLGSVFDKVLRGARIPVLVRVPSAAADVGRREE